MINEDALMARVIHIDSRLRKSGRAEDMVYELNEPIHLPRGAVCWCTAITLPFSLTNVSILNNTLHFIERTRVGATAQSNAAQVDIDADEYGRTGLGQALEAALNSHVSRGASILPKAVTYSVDNSQSHELSFSLLWNGDPDRYDYTGSYQVDSTTTISNVYRDWRSLTDSTKNEYVMSPVYQWADLIFTIRHGSSVYYTGPVTDVSNTGSGYQSQIEYVPTHAHDPHAVVTGAAGDWTRTGIAGAETWTSVQNDPVSFQYQGSDGTRTITFLAWNGMQAIRFQETRSTQTLHFAWNGSSFDEEDGKVSWQWNPPPGFQTTGRYPTNVARVTLQFSFNFQTPEPRIDYVLEILPYQGSTNIYNSTALYDDVNRTFTAALNPIGHNHYLEAPVVSFSGYPRIESAEPVPGGTGLSWNGSGQSAINLTGSPAPDQTTVPLNGKALTLTYGTATRVYTKASGPDLMTDYGYSFEIPAEVTLRGTNSNPRSINGRLGNMNIGNPDRSGEKNAASDKGVFKCFPKLTQAGESVYLCSSTLSGHAVLLPNGSQTALSRVTLRDRSGGYNQSVPEALKQHESLERVYVDCGNSVLRSINFTWRDHSGNLVPLGEHDWSAQLCFGFPQV